MAKRGEAQLLLFNDEKIVGAYRRIVTDAINPTSPEQLRRGDFVQVRICKGDNPDDTRDVWGIVQIGPNSRGEFKGRFVEKVSSPYDHFWDRVSNVVDWVRL